jgi:hypothetical protein
MTKDVHQSQRTNQRRRHVQMGPLKCIQGNQIGNTRNNNPHNKGKVGWIDYNIRQGWPTKLVWNMYNKAKKNLYDCHECWFFLRHGNGLTYKDKWGANSWEFKRIFSSQKQGKMNIIR